MREVMTCRICNVEKPIHEFGTQRKAKSGRDSRCRKCATAYKKASAQGMLTPTTRYDVVWPRVCPKCKVAKGEEEYPLDPRRKSGRHSYCRPCKAQDMSERRSRRRDSGLLAMDNLKRAAKNTGTTVEHVLKLNEELKGRCEICGGLPTGNHGRLVLDHDHSTGLFRGLLCGHCNNALGLMEDNPGRLRRAAQYLERGTL